MNIMIAFLFSIFAVSLAWSADGKEIMEKVNLQNSPTTEQVDFNMKLVDSKDRITERNGTQYTKRKKDKMVEAMRLFRFHNPAEMAKSAVLLIENIEKDNDQWIYLPATYATRRIPARNRGDRYMGTDFSYEDAVSPKLSDYNFQISGTEIINGRECEIIDQIAIAPQVQKESIYSKITQYVDSKYIVIVKANYYDKSNNLIKTYNASQITQCGNFYRANHVEMEDFKFHHKTIIDYKNRNCASEIKESYFSIRSLERPE
jgi:hypothetical protein